VVEAQYKTEAAIKLVEVLRAETVRHTFPSDWVVMGKQAFLQTQGCERIATAWGIQMDPVSLRNDIVKEELQGTDGVRHVQYLVQVRGRSLRTGEEYSDIGSRSTLGDFFKKRWVNAEVEEKLLIEADVRKAAIANAYGRVIRKLTGTNGMPPEELKRLGIDVEKARKAEFQKGSKGGSAREGNGDAAYVASESQLKKLAMQISKDEKVLDGDAVIEYDDALKLLKKARPNRQVASALIKKLDALEEPIDLELFKQGLNPKRKEDNDDEGQ
jgi:hypothetical protein